MCIRDRGREETEDYIFYRMEKAGNREAVTFADGVMDLIYRFSSGIPRLINVLSDFILLAAFADQARDITLDMVREVVEDLDILGESEVLEEVEVVDEASYFHQKENLLERISMHENILKVLMSKQREEFTRLSTQLEALSAQMADVKTIAEWLRLTASNDEELRSGKKKLFSRSLSWS